MSGRVRWERWARSPRFAIGEAISLYDEHRLYAYRDDDGWHACDSRAFMAGASDDVTEHVTRRRSDAKRWLLARAAGLAEVPTMRKPRRWDAVSARLAVCIAGRNRRRR